MGPCRLGVPTVSLLWASLLPSGICCVPALGQGSEGSPAGPFRLLFPLAQYRLGEESRKSGSHPQRGPGVRGEGLRGVWGLRPFGGPLPCSPGCGRCPGPRRASGCGTAGEPWRPRGGAAAARGAPRGPGAAAEPLVSRRGHSSPLPQRAPGSVLPIPRPHPPKALLRTGGHCKSGGAQARVWVWGADRGPRGHLVLAASPSSVLPPLSSPRALCRAHCWLCPSPGKVSVAASASLQ